MRAQGKCDDQAKHKSLLTHAFTSQSTFTQVAVYLLDSFWLLLPLKSEPSPMDLPLRLPLSSGFLLLFLLLIPHFASSDLAKDRQECAEQLVGLAPCLSYVGGEAKTPTIDCCTGLKQVIEKSKKCLCLLIKYRNEPDLGFTLNASLAVNLPSACHAPSNISQCIDLLHLAPNSSDAKVYEGFDKITHSNSSSSTSASTPVSPTGKGSSPSTSADEKNGGGSVAVWEKRRLVAQVVGVIIPFVLTFLV